MTPLVSAQWGVGTLQIGIAAIFSFMFPYLTRMPQPMEAGTATTFFLERRPGTFYTTADRHSLLYKLLVLKAPHLQQDIKYMEQTIAMAKSFVQPLNDPCQATPVKVEDTYHIACNIDHGAKGFIEGLIPGDHLFQDVYSLVKNFAVLQKIDLSKPKLDLSFVSTLNLYIPFLTEKTSKYGWGCPRVLFSKRAIDEGLLSTLVGSIKNFLKAKEADKTNCLDPRTFKREFELYLTCPTEAKDGELLKTRTSLEAFWTETLQKYIARKKCAANLTGAVPHSTLLRYLVQLRENLRKELPKFANMSTISAECKGKLSIGSASQLFETSGSYRPEVLSKNLYLLHNFRAQWYGQSLERGERFDQLFRGAMNMDAFTVYVEDLIAVLALLQNSMPVDPQIFHTVAHLLQKNGLGKVTSVFPQKVKPAPRGLAFYLKQLFSAPTVDYSDAHELWRAQELYYSLDGAGARTFTKRKADDAEQKDGGHGHDSIRYAPDRLERPSWVPVDAPDGLHAALAYGVQVYDKQKISEKLADAPNLKEIFDNRSTNEAITSDQTGPDISHLAYMAVTNMVGVLLVMFTSRIRLNRSWSFLPNATGEYASGLRHVLATQAACELIPSSLTSLCRLANLFSWGGACIFAIKFLAGMSGRAQVPTVSIRPKLLIGHLVANLFSKQWDLVGFSGLMPPTSIRVPFQNPFGTGLLSAADSTWLWLIRAVLLKQFGLKFSAVASVLEACLGANIDSVSGTPYLNLAIAAFLDCCISPGQPLFQSLVAQIRSASSPSIFLCVVGALLLASGLVQAPYKLWIGGILVLLIGGTGLLNLNPYWMLVTKVLDEVVHLNAELPPKVAGFIGPVVLALGLWNNSDFQNIAAVFTGLRTLFTWLRAGGLQAWLQPWLQPLVPRRFCARCRASLDFLRRNQWILFVLLLIYVDPADVKSRLPVEITTGITQIRLFTAETIQRWSPMSLQFARESVMLLLAGIKSAPGSFIRQYGGMLVAIAFMFFLSPKIEFKFLAAASLGPKVLACPAGYQLVQTCGLFLLQALSVKKWLIRPFLVKDFGPAQTWNIPALYHGFRRRTRFISAVLFTAYLFNPLPTLDLAPALGLFGRQLGTSQVVLIASLSVLACSLMNSMLSAPVNILRLKTI